MATSSRSVLVDHTTTAALEEKAKLRKHFGRFDIFFFLICTLVGLDTIGTVANKGAQAFTWLIFLGIFFFVPYALLTSELGTKFPEEGGPYMWPRLAFGRVVAALNTMIYWIANPVWIGGSLAILSVTAFGKFFTPLTGFWQYAFAFVFIWFTIVSAIVSFQVGKWIPTIGAAARIVILAFFTFSVVLYAIKHGVHGFGGGEFGPSYIGFIGLVPVLFFNYVGFELPNAAGEEMKNPQRDVPFAVARSTIGTVLLYGGPILAILLVLPTSQITSLGGFLDAIKTVFTVYGGSVAKNGTVTLTGFGQFMGYLGAIAFIFALMTSGSTWIMGSDRTLAVASYDGCGPRILGRFSSRFGTPVNVNILSGIIATVLMILAFNLTSGNAGKYFTVVLGLAISTTTISYLAIFPSLYKLRKMYPDVPGSYRIPGGNVGVLICSGLPLLWAILATVVLLWPGLGVGWFHTAGTADASLPTGFTRTQYELSQFIPLLAFFVLGIIFYILGAPTRKQVADVSLVPEAARQAPLPV
jgi:glutamate:GABA antiporter